MPGIIDSAPDCVTSVDGAIPADDSADFIIQAAYEKCAGHHDLRPGQHLRRGAAPPRRRSYYILTWIGIIVMVAVLVAWVMYRAAHAARARAPPREADAAPLPSSIG